MLSLFTGLDIRPLRVRTHLSKVTGNVSWLALSAAELGICSVGSPSCAVGGESCWLTSG